MRDLQIELAIKFIASMKKHWRKTNPYVDVVMNHLMEKYGELPRPDHMAIRSISGVGFGIQEANSLFSALGYKFGNYWPIPDLNINACHFEPPTPELEKIFFSEIQMEQIGKNIPEKEFASVKKKIRKMVWNTSESVSGICAQLYDIMNAKKYYTKQWTKSDIFNLAVFFTCSPWDLLNIRDSDFRWLSEKPYLQETAHVLAYGFIPNHFTFLMKDQSYTFPGYTSMRDLSKEIESLGIPMQEHAEGNEESILCQVSTKACKGKFSAYQHINGCAKNMKIEWPMSYIEFIKRGADTNSPTGRYEGFLPNQAKTLFKMTAPAYRHAS